MRPLALEARRDRCGLRQHLHTTRGELGGGPRRGLEAATAPRRVPAQQAAPLEAAELFAHRAGAERESAGERLLGGWCLLGDREQHDEAGGAERHDRQRMVHLPLQGA